MMARTGAREWDHRGGDESETRSRSDEFQGLVSWHCRVWFYLRAVYFPETGLLRWAEGNGLGKRAAAAAASRAGILCWVHVDSFDH